jgi:hypothetical protein
MMRTVAYSFSLVSCTAASVRVCDVRPSREVVLDAAGTILLAGHARRTMTLSASRRKGPALPGLPGRAVRQALTTACPSSARSR